jgi:hypothetical protein
VLGYTDSVDFPTTPGAYNAPFNHSSDCFVAKLNANGTGLVYSAIIGGRGGDSPEALAVDAAGAAYVVGRTGSPSSLDPPPEFPTTPGAYDQTYGRDLDGFVAKLHPSGSSLVYSTYFGANGRDEIYDVAVDGSGQACIVGRTDTSPDFPTTPGAYDRTHNGAIDAFVAKLSADGSALVYSTFIGGASEDKALAVAVDGAGAIFVAGTAFTPSSGATFPTTAGAYDTGHNGLDDLFVLKLDAPGSSLLYSTLVGGVDYDEVRGLAIDSLGAVYIVGATRSTDYPTTPGAHDRTFDFATDAFLTKVDPTGTSLAFSTFFGAGGGEGLNAVAVDSARAVYVTGRFGTIPTTAGAYDRTFNGDEDAVFAKFASSGSTLVYASYLGSSGEDVGNAIALDASGNAYVTGVTMHSPSSGGFPTTPGAFDTTYSGEQDAFVTKVNATGSALVYSTLFGGNRASADESARAIAVDDGGNRYVTGSTRSLDFPTTPGAYDDEHSDVTRQFSNEDIFVTKTDPSGLTLLQSTYIGGGYKDRPSAIALLPDGSAVVAGLTESDDYPTTPGAVDTTYAGATEGFVTRLNATGSALVFSTMLGGSVDDWVEGVATDPSGGIYVVGGTQSPGFPTTPGAFDTTFNEPLEGSTHFEAFVARLDPASSALVYSTLIGGSSDEFGSDIAVDAEGNVYVTGQTTSVDFPTTPGAYDTTLGTAGTGEDVFVAKIDPSGSALEYGTYLGGTSREQLAALALDRTGAAYVTGITLSSNFPTTPGAYQSGGGVFVTKLDATGSALSYSTTIGVRDNHNEIEDIVVTAAGAACITGSIDRNFPTTFDAFDQSHNGKEDGFLTIFDATGSSLIYSTMLGGESDDRAFGLALDALDAIYVVGQTQSLHFPLASPFQGELRGWSDGFVAKFTPIVAGDSVGIYIGSTGTWFLTNANGSGSTDAFFGYGAGGSLVALVGDWDGDGTDTPGLYVPSTGAFFLKNANGGGGADLVFTFGAGNQEFVPLAGDWDGNGSDTIGLYVPSSGVFFLRNANASGDADVVFTFGPGGAGFEPLMGDWNGDGVDTVGLYVASTGTFFLKNANEPGSADLVFGYGPAGARPVRGDWNGDGVDTIGIYLGSAGAWFLRNGNSPGSAHLVFGYGPADAVPLVGDWDGQ